MAETQDILTNEPSIPPSLNGFEESLSRLSSKPGVIATIILDAENGAILKKNSMSNVSPLFNAAQDPSVPRSDVDEFAVMVWKFMSAAGKLIHNLDSEDEVKLLRLRTKKNELVIVPDLKFILIVVHEMTS